VEEIGVLHPHSKKWLSMKKVKGVVWRTERTMGHFDFFSTMGHETWGTVG
jgi:hypothetical protein